MNRTNLCRRFLLLPLLVACAASVCAAQGSPEVNKVEPPNWWAGHSINPVRVLLRGRNLGGARVEAVGAGIQTGLLRANAAGTYLFVDVSIDAKAAPGVRRLRVTSAAGTTEAPFEISTPLARAGRFQGFTPDDVIYLIMPDRFSDGDPSNNDPAVSRGLYNRTQGRYYHGGDFQGIINRLPYLKELGVNVIWLNPWYDNVNHLNEREMPEGKPITDYHGYGAVDFYGVEEHFGDMEKLRELIDKAHRLGIKVMQDQVANHSGPYHPWVTDSPTPTWYNGTQANHIDETWQTWTLQDPRATYQMQRATLEGWFLNILPDLNQNDEETSRYIIQNTLWWIGATGIDAIRQDTLPYVQRSFWHDWMSAIKREYPRFNVVGELYDGDPALVSFFQGGAPRFDGIDSRIDSEFDFPVFYPLRRAFAEGRSIKEIPQMLARDHLYPNAGALVVFLGNHDMLRFMNEKGATATGLKLAQTFILTTRGTPQLYYGDEIAIAGGGDPDNRRDFPGGFAGDARNAFTRQGRNAEQQDVFEHVQRLIRLRAELEPLRRGALAHLYAAEQQYAYARTTADASVIVAFNNDTKPAAFEFNVAAANFDDGTRLDDRLDTIKTGTPVENGMIKLNIPARSASILAVRAERKR
ncbi:MAG TPA: alpha-amylase family glycosyl hydrolase [Pyrinomonadaceae bacterium]|nr:alpha-amylase family glycosyl hydrolase [Pyrinomonadaceae bacterium]